MKRITTNIRLGMILMFGSLCFQSCEYQNNTNASDSSQEMTISRTSDYSVEISYLPVEDSSITEIVNDEFLIQKGVEGANINVSTVEGIVTLTGKAQSILEKERAVNITQSIKGVRGVIDKIDVAESERSDEDLQILVGQALVRNPSTELLDLTPKIGNSTVTLNGSVESWQEKFIAERVVKDISGINSVDNNIIVHEREFRPDSEIKKDIESILDWDIRVDNELIDVNVENSVVYLSGIVGSVAEKTLAKQLSMMTSVKDVVHDELTVERWARDDETRKSKYSFRSDDEIKSAISDIFLYDTRISRYNLDIFVEDGSVTLTGVVSNINAKEVAEQDASNIVGVWNVKNLIKVEEPSQIQDSLIQANVENAFITDPYLENYEIGVTVSDGNLLLSGVVDNSFERNRAKQIASYIKGITKIDNDLSVNDGNYMPYVYDYSFHTYYVQDEVRTEFENIKTDNEILADTEEQIYWSPFVNEEEVEVTVDNGVITLRGTVLTPRERMLAEKNAYEAGAISVTNDIYVAYGPNPIN